MFELIQDSTGDVIRTGTEYECLKKFHSICPFSFMDHREYTFETYTLKPVPKLPVPEVNVDTDVFTLPLRVDSGVVKDGFGRVIVQMNREAGETPLTPVQRDQMIKLIGNLLNGWFEYHTLSDLKTLKF
jgi:hypothetical protein